MQADVYQTTSRLCIIAIIIIIIFITIALLACEIMSLKCNLILRQGRSKTNMQATKQKCIKMC